jgi:hypothetical protein
MSAGGLALTVTIVERTDDLTGSGHLAPRVWWSEP